MKRIFGWFWRRKKLTVVLIIIAAIAFFFVTRGNGNGELEEAAVSRGDVAEELILTGFVAADEHAQLAFPTAGKITWINVREGDTVQPGQALAKLDTIALNSALQRANADLRAAEANVAAVYDGLQNKDTTETFAERNTRTAAEVGRDKAYEAVIAAQQNLRDSTLVAPFNGLVTFVANSFIGINTSPTQTQIEVVNPETIFFEVAADQTEVVEIATGERVRIFLDALDEEFLGTVVYVAHTPIANEIGTVYRVKISLENLENSNFIYRIGMSGDAHFVLSENKNVLYVPGDFISSDAGGDYVLTGENKEKVYIEIGLEGEERTEVVSGLAEGALIYD